MVGPHKEKVEAQINAGPLRNVMNPTPAQPPTIAGTPSLSVRTLRSFEEVEELRTVWERWQYHPNSDIDYYLLRFKFRPEFLHPHVIVVYRDGEPDAILVGRLDYAETQLKIGYLHLGKLRTRTLSFLHAGLLGNPSQENCQLIIREIVRSLRREQAQMAVLANLVVGSPLYRCALSIPGVFERDHFHGSHSHCTMEVPKSADDIYRRLSAKGRKNLKWQAKKLMEDFPGNVTVGCFSTSSDLERMIRDVEEVAKKTYQRGLRVGFTDSLELHERFRLAAEKGRLRSYVLYIGGCPAAFWVGTTYQGTAHLHFLGYDPQYEHYSPGSFLITKVFDMLCGQSMEKIDFGYGEESYKQRFGNCRWQEATIRIYKPSFRGLGIKLLTMQADLVEHVARRGLDRLGLLSKLKRGWRRHVRKGDSLQGSKEKVKDGE